MGWRRGGGVGRFRGFQMYEGAPVWLGSELDPCLGGSVRSGVHYREPMTLISLMHVFPRVWWRLRGVPGGPLAVRPLPAPVYLRLGVDAGGGGGSPRRVARGGDGVVPMRDTQV